jgi:hypothetical protein
MLLKQFQVKYSIRVYILKNIFLFLKNELGIVRKEEKTNFISFKFPFQAESHIKKTTKTNLLDWLILA